MEGFVVLVIMTHPIFYWYNIKLMSKKKETVTSLWHGDNPFSRRMKRNKTSIVSQIVLLERGYFIMISLYLITLINLKNSEIKLFIKRKYFIQL
jgi:hypothetical protein